MGVLFVCVGSSEGGFSFHPDAVTRFHVTLKTILTSTPQDMSLIAKIHTVRGFITAELFADQAPLTVANFVNLAQRGFYDHLTFHRVIADFMIQGGCPDGSGRGGPGYRFEDETDPALIHEPYTLSMANSGPGTNGSQFFITHVATPWLNGKHTVFGRVIEGQAIVDRIQQGDEISQVTIAGPIQRVLEARADRVRAWNAALDQA